MADPVSITDVVYTGLGLTIGDTININYVLAFGIPAFATLTVVEEGVGTPLTYTEISAGILQVIQDGTTPASGTFVLTLDVPTDSFARDIEDGNLFKEETLEDLFTQALIISGSVAEGRLAVLQQDLDFGNNKALNVGTGTVSTDGVNKGQMDTAITAELATASIIRTDAEAARDAAIANAVLTAADVVSTNADVVLTHADVTLTNADVILADAARVGSETARDEAVSVLASLNFDTTDVSASRAITASDHLKALAVDTTAAVVLTLPLATSLTDDIQFMITKRTGGNDITLATSGAELVGGETTQTFTVTGVSRTIKSDKDNGTWYISKAGETLSGTGADSVEILGTASGAISIAIGNGSTATNSSSLAIGNGSTVSQANASAYGRGSVGSGSNATAIGSYAQATQTTSSSLGYNARAQNTDAIALGANSVASALRSTALGVGSDATNTASLALGYNTNATHSLSTALGQGASTTAANQIVLGTVTESVEILGTLTVAGNAVGADASTTVKGVVELATDAEVATGTDLARVAPVSALNAHSGMGKGWINFNGTGTIAIRDSHNVSSIVDNGTGLYTVNWDVDFANTNYCATYGGRRDAASVGLGLEFNTRAVGSIQAETYGTSTTNTDWDYVEIIAMGEQ